MMNNIKTSLFISIVVFFNSFTAQDVNINDIDWTSSSPNGACGCSTNFNNGSVQNFHDTGGANADYNSNENETITLCPDGTGSKMVAVFAINAGYTLNIDPSDTLFVFDGPDNSYPILAKINDNTFPNGVNIPASWSNQSGCLTFQFISDGSIEGSGWDANLSCSNLSQPFFNHMTAFIGGEANGAGDTINDIFPLDTGYIDVCLGDTIQFIADPYFPYEPGGDSAALSGGGYMQSNNYTTTWELSNGTTFNGNSFQFIPQARQGYYVTMKVEESNGIFSYLSAKVRVSTVPNFSSCQAADETICLGRTTELYGGVTSTDTVGVDPVSANFPIGGVFAAQTYLPDGSGINYTTDIVISGFTPGGTIQSATDIDQMCVSMEHSYLGDLEMKLSCPNGQSINVFNSYSGFGASGELFPGGFSGGTDFLGGAFDNNTGNIGVCEEYCFSNNIGSLPSWNNGYNTTTASGPSPGNMIIPSTYNPEVSFFPALQNCPINGTWTLTVRDNIGVDDGYICEWGIYFNSTLMPNSETYAPLISSESWLSNPTIILDNDTNIVVQPNSLGSNNYTFQVQDQFGCFYDTIITVETVLGGMIIGDTVTCDDFFQYAGVSAPAQGGEWSYVGSGNVVFNPSNTTLNPLVNVDEYGLYQMNFYDNFCEDTLTHMIEFVAGPEVVNLPDDTICFGNDFFIQLDSSGSELNYEWFDESGTLIGITDSTWLSTASFDFGTTTITLESSNNCGVIESFFDLLIQTCEIPNVITPNDDGDNDYFITNYAQLYSDVHLIVFNRWGRKVYETTSYQNDWNGLNNSGKPLADGTYFYVLTYNSNSENITGNINILGRLK